jgi:pyruvate formate lyase activating enzyme
LKIAGFQKFTLLDYPEKTACIIFTRSCNMKCPFCHNSSLVLSDKLDTKDENDIFDFLKTRIGLLDGVCITGGEPTLQSDLKQFIYKIKELDFLVKLDTNGTNPDILIDLIESNLIDYVAMDVKNTIGKYNITCGNNNISIDSIRKSIDYLLNSDIDYEFRTTVLKDYHTESDMERISDTLQGCKRYYLQKFIKSNNIIDDRCEELDDETLIKYLHIVQKKIPYAELRGVDYIDND